MIALQTAIRTWFTTSSQSSYFTGGLWIDQAPEGTQMPYVEMSDISAPLTLGYGSKRSAPLFQFCAFGTDHDAVGVAFEAFVNALDNTILTLSSGQMFDSRRLDEPHDDLMPPDGDGQDVWRWMSQYLFGVHL